MDQFQPFAMERFMYKYEQAVDYDLSESGVHLLKPQELLGDDHARLGKLPGTKINYAYANGKPDLAELEAKLTGPRTLSWAPHGAYVSAPALTDFVCAARVTGRPR